VNSIEMLLSFINIAQIDLSITQYIYVFARWRHSATKLLNKKVTTAFNIQYCRSSPTFTHFGRGVFKIFAMKHTGLVFFGPPCTLKKREQNRLLVRSGKSEAELTSNTSLHSTYTIEATKLLIDTKRRVASLH